MHFNEKSLQEMGLSAMPEDQKQSFLDYIQEELEVRIGKNISRGLTRDQLSRFDEINDQGEVIKWLEENRPDYRKVVDDTVKEIKDEIHANRDDIIG